MSLPRFAARRDTSEGPIVDVLLAHGFSVARLSAKKIPDLLLGKHGKTRVAECKTGRRKLEAGQDQWWALWRGNAKIVLRTPADAEKLAAEW